VTRRILVDSQTIDAISRMVATVGFPVAMATILVWYIIKTLNGKLDKITDAATRGADASERNTEALKELTAEVRRLYDQRIVR
jgi:cell division protein ZapA (FtsZ GTPase activity inhibitor)